MDTTLSTRYFRSIRFALWLVVGAMLTAAVLTTGMPVSADTPADDAPVTGADGR